MDSENMNLPHHHFVHEQPAGVGSALCLDMDSAGPDGGGEGGVIRMYHIGRVGQGVG